MLLIVFLTFLATTTYQLTSQPTWLNSSYFCSGQHKPINPTSSSTWISPGTYTVTQLLNNNCQSFGNTPRIILSLQGYKQNIANNTLVGFTYIITNTSSTSFISNYTIYGSNMMYLYYRYLGIASQASQYYTSYQNLILGTGSNINNTGFTPLSSTQVYPNPPNQNFTNIISTNKIRSKIFLIGFKINTNTTGLHIQLSSQITSGVTHSISITTSGSCQIFQITYFRLVFDYTAQTRGYVVFIDQLKLKTGVSNCRSVSFGISGYYPGNYLMGLNYIYLSSSYTIADFLLYNIYSTSTTSSTSITIYTFNGINNYAQYLQLQSNIFNHRIRSCTNSTPYYNPSDKLCYDSCPVNKFNVISTYYCQQCYNTCLTCTGSLSTNCLSCDSTLYRIFNSSSKQCLCRPGYYQIYTNTYYIPSANQCSQYPPAGTYKPNNICQPCINTCQTCQQSSSYCLSCYTNQYRILNISTHTCPCTNSYYQPTLYNISVCQSCNPTCLTCSLLSTNCTTCNTVHNRILAYTNSCNCISGYYQISAYTPVVCLQCDSKCLTCRNNATYCQSCNYTRYRILGNNTCICMNGYYQTLVNMQSVCLICDPTCLTCSRISTNCATCRIDYNRILKNINNTYSICQCNIGYYQSRVNNVVSCLTCMASCYTCNSLYACLTCNTAQNRVYNNITQGCDCKAGYYQPSTSTSNTCMLCSSSCVTCQYSSNFCTSCNYTLNRVLNTNSNTCVCRNGYSQMLISSVLTCIACSPNCPNSACNVSLFLALNTNTNTCVCMNGYYNDTVNNTGCKPCAIVGCLRCVLQPIQLRPSCIDCDQNRLFNSFQLIQNTNANRCACPSGYYINRNRQICQTCHYSCLSCTNSTSCSICSSNNHYRILPYNSNNNNQQSYCLCMPGYYNNATNPICLQCNPNCQTCQNSPTNCLSCNQTLRYLQNNTCICNPNRYQYNNTCIINQSYIPPLSPQLCGNGHIDYNQECDDYNIQDNDGCSKICKIQQYHACMLYNNNNGTSLCYYNNKISLQLQKVYKILNDNKIDITIKINAYKCNMKKLQQYMNNIHNMIQFTNKGRLLQNNDAGNGGNGNMLIVSGSRFVIIDQDNGQGVLYLVLDYNTDITTLQNKYISIANSNSQSSISKYFYHTPQSLTTLKNPSNKIPIKYLPSNIYNSINIISIIFLIIICISLLFYIIISIIDGSVIAIQNIIIIQFTYFCIVGQKQLQLFLAVLGIYGRYVNGFNINILQQKQKIINSCNKLLALQLQCNSIDNINIMFWLGSILFMFIVACMVYKYRRNKQIQFQQSQNYQLELQDQTASRNRDNLQQSNNNNNNNNNNNLEINTINNKQNKQKQNKKGYQLPNKIRKIINIFIQIVFGMYFITAVQYLLVSVNVGYNYLLASIIWSVFVGILFIGLWIFYFSQYQKLRSIVHLSYINVLRPSNKKINLQKIFYPLLFLLLIIWGVILTFVPGIATYLLLILLCFTWLVLIHRFNLYRTRNNKIRATINQIITISIVIIYIILEYVVKDGVGFVYVIIIQVLLFIGLINNIVFCTYDMILKRRGQCKQKHIEKQKQLFKNVEDEYRAVSLQKRIQDEQIRIQQLDQNQTQRQRQKQKQKEKQKQNRKVKINLKQFQSMTIRRQLLVDGTDTKEALKGKLNQLKALRQQVQVNSFQTQKNKKIKQGSLLQTK